MKCIIPWPNSPGAWARLIISIILIPSIGWLFISLLDFAWAVGNGGSVELEWKFRSDSVAVAYIVGFVGASTASLVVIFLPICLWLIQKIRMSVGPFVGLVVGWFLLSVWAGQSFLGVTLVDGIFYFFGVAGFGAAAILAVLVNCKMSNLP